MYLLKSYDKSMISIVIFLGILGIIATLLMHISEQHHQFRHKQLASIKTILVKKPTIEAITIGSSHSNAIDFSALGKSGEYMNIGGIDMYEASYTVDQILGEIPSLTTIYMAIAYPMLWVDNAKIRSTTRIKNYYSLPKPFLPCTRLINSDLINCIKASLLPITRYDNWEKVLTQSKQKTFQRRSGRKNMTQNFLIKRANHHLALAQQGSDAILASTTKYLEYTIQKAQQHNADIVFFTPPYHPDYVQIINEQNPNLIKKTHDIMLKLSKKYSVFYKDYNSLNFPVSGFRNSDHLNDQGAILFSSYLKNDVEQYTHTLKHTNINQ